jgi:hypothetical protein
MKIAVCLSGETRNFNRVLGMPDHRGPVDFINELKKFYPTVDVFGHTWSHCETPHELGFKFKKFQQDDQEIIDNWVKEDFLNRAYSNRDMWNPQHKLSDISPEDFVNAYLQRSRAAYGQVFSAFKCFDLLPYDEYDVVIRYRWDLQHNGDTNFFQQTVIDRFSWLMRRTAQGHTAGMGTGNTTLYTGHPPLITMEDTFFMLNQLGHEYLRSIPIEHRLSSIFQSSWGNEKEEAHMLWLSAIFHPITTKKKRLHSQESIMFALHLPNMFQIIRFQDERGFNPGVHLND